MRAAMQIPSLLQIEGECKDGGLVERIGPISDDTIGARVEIAFGNFPRKYSRSIVIFPAV